MHPANKTLEMVNGGVGLCFGISLFIPIICRQNIPLTFCKFLQLVDATSAVMFGAFDSPVEALRLRGRFFRCLGHLQRRRSGLRRQPRSELKRVKIRCENQDGEKREHGHRRRCWELKLSTVLERSVRDGLGSLSNGVNFR